MRTLKTKQLIAVIAAAGLSLGLAACSSDEEASPEASASSSASAAALDPSASAAPIVAAGAAADACAAYFELDLLNSAYAGGAVADGDLTEEQAKDQFKSLLKEMVVQSKAAIQDGSGDAKMAANATRMRKVVRSLTKDEALSDLSTNKQTRFAKSSLRMQKACDRAGYPLPDDNVTARTAAGI